MEQGHGMTEQTLDVLRTHAERLVDEAQRFQRSLRGSNANEDQAREHLTNVSEAAEKCWRDGLRVAVPEPAFVPDVIDQTERAIAPPVETRGATQRKRGK